MENRPRPDYTPYLVKHIMYAKQHYPKPKFSEEAIEMLNLYYAGIRKTFGSPRIRDTIFKIAQNLARLKLKDTVDAADAKETMQYYNLILLEMEMVVVAVSSNPREEAYEKCLEILMGLVSPIAFEELIKRACERNEQVAKYIGTVYRLTHNKKLRPILDMLRNHSRVEEVQTRPIVLQYIQDGPVDKADKADKADKTDYDLYDHYDLDLETAAQPQEKNNERGLSQSHKDTSQIESSTEGPEKKSERKNIFSNLHTFEKHGHKGHKGHNAGFERKNTGPEDLRQGHIGHNEGKYDHLILEERTESGHRIYRCKEHPDMLGMPYYDLKGIMVSHFEYIHEQLASFRKEK